MVRVIADSMMFLSGLGFLVFLAGFGTQVPWRKSPMGRHIMGFMGALGSVVIYAIAINTGIVERNEAGRAVVWGLVAAVVWWRAVMFARIWYRSRHGSEEEK